MNTVTVPNTIATGGSTGADVNGRAVQVMSALTQASSGLKALPQRSQLFSTPFGTFPPHPTQT